MSVEEFPERPDQPECTYYLKTGDCKFKYKCKYHHPKNRLPKQAAFSFNDKGLPLRPVSFFPMLFFCASIRKPLRNFVCSATELDISGEFDSGQKL
jgi:hypothetical protein